jgi:hypothetical protein
MIQEWKKAIKEERIHRVQSMIPIPDDEDEKLQEALEVSTCEVEFQRGGAL